MTLLKITRGFLRQLMFTIVNFVFKVRRTWGSADVFLGFNHRWRTQGLFANLTVICCWSGYKMEHEMSICPQITAPTQHRHRSLYGLHTYMTVSFNLHLSYTSVTFDHEYCAGMVCLLPEERMFSVQVLIMCTNLSISFFLH